MTISSSFLFRQDTALKHSLCVSRYQYILLLPLLLVPVSLEAASAQEQIDDRLRQESQRRIFERLKKQQREKLTPFQKPEELAPTQPAQEDRCFSINTIDVVGSTLLDQQQIDEVINKYKGSCLYTKDLVGITDQITALYIDKGYITSMAYLEEQDISDGGMEISIMEGRIEKVGDESPGLRTAFLGQKGEHLNLRDLEVSLDRINRLPSHYAKLDMLPGASEGWSVVDVPIERQRPWRATLSANNYGDEDTGEDQAAFSIQWDNPLGLFDQITIQTNASVPHRKRSRTGSNSLNYSIPFGRLLLNYNFSKSDYKLLVQEGMSEWQAKGRSRSHDLSFDYRLFHDAKHRIDLGAFVNTYKTENYVGGERMDQNSYDLSKVGFSIGHIYQIEDITTALRLTYIKGVDDFGASHKTDLNEKYDAWQLDGTLVKRFSSFAYMLNMHGQYAGDPQFGPNQISIGGPYSVRGFNETGLNGNTGAYMRNELSIPVLQRGNDWLELYLAMDAGWVKKEPDSVGGDILGSALGMRASLAGVNVDLFYSAPLDDHDVPGNSDFAGLSLSYQY